MAIQSFFLDLLSDHGSTENLSVIAEEAETCRSSNSLDSRNDIDISKKFDIARPDKLEADFKGLSLKSASGLRISENEDDEIIHSEKIIIYDSQSKDVLAKSEDTEGEDNFEDRESLEIVYL
jgi:hypothetical protein